MGEPTVGDRSQHRVTHTSHCIHHDQKRDCNILAAMLYNPFPYRAHILTSTSPHFSTAAAISPFKGTFPGTSEVCVLVVPSSEPDITAVSPSSIGNRGLSRSPFIKCRLHCKASDWAFLPDFFFFIYLSCGLLISESRGEGVNKSHPSSRTTLESYKYEWSLAPRGDYLSLAASSQSLYV